jgi:hypothetical protein
MDAVPDCEQAFRIAALCSRRLPNLLPSEPALIFRPLGIVCSFVLVAGLSACSGPTAALRDPGPAAKGLLRVTDVRPAEEVKFNVHCASLPGREIGEAVCLPSRIEALQARLERALGDGAEGRDIRLHRFQACIESNGRNAAGLAAVSYTAAVVAEGGMPYGVDLVSVDLDLEIDGVRHRTSTARSCHIGYVTTYATESKRVRDAIWSALDLAVSNIAKEITKQ